MSTQSLPFFIRIFLTLGSVFLGVPARGGQTVPLPQQSDDRGKILFDGEHIRANLKRYVQDPHPMASPAQKKLGRQIKKEISKNGWKTEFFTFKATVPNLSAQRFGGSETKADASKQIEGENLVASYKGDENCAVVVGGHYDTKYFRNIKFVAANDGGSSTALMQEFSRVFALIKKQEKNEKKEFKNKNADDYRKRAGRYADCSIFLIFFDGEEAHLADWNDGETQLGIQDHLYGSRAFAATLLKGKTGVELKGLPIALMIFIDMVGHKDQNLFITSGSDQVASQKLVTLKRETKIETVPLGIEDDHAPFLKIGVPLIHIIDWTNIKEWHTELDNESIISYAKVADFGNLLLRFFLEQRENIHG